MALQVTAAPGCFCFSSQRGGSGGDESRMKCTVHMNATTGGEERQMGSSLAQEVKTDIIIHDAVKSLQFVKMPCITVRCGGRP